MMDFKELHDLALKLTKEPPLTTENIYVDLLLTLMISDIQEDTGFVLKGGTAIIKPWLYPYRFSYDLDFSYYDHGNPRKHYKKFQEMLENRITRLGFRIDNEKNDRYREGGRILVLKMMDGPQHLRIPLKLSVSSIDEKPCFTPSKKSFKPLVSIPSDYELLFPEIVPKLNATMATVLSIEELCAEKIRALATRGRGEEWVFLLRDAADLCVMEKEGVLDRVLNEEKYLNCLRHKFTSIHGTSYEKKYQDFLSSAPDVEVHEEDLAIFLDQTVVDKEKAARIIGKVQSALKRIL